MAGLDGENGVPLTEPVEFRLRVLEKRVEMIHRMQLAALRASVDRATADVSRPVKHTIVDRVIETLFSRRVKA